MKTTPSIPLFLLLVGGFTGPIDCLTDPSVPASFFPFGTDENDNIVPVGDDASSPAVIISAGFPFLYGNHSRVFVSTEVHYANDVISYPPAENKSSPFSAEIRRDLTVANI